MSSLVSNFNSLTVIGSTGQEIVNWVTTADFAVGKFVQTHRNCRQLVANCVHTASASAVCIGHKARAYGRWTLRRQPAFPRYRTTRSSYLFSLIRSTVRPITVDLRWKDRQYDTPAHLRMHRVYALWGWRSHLLMLVRHGDEQQPQQQQQQQQQGARLRASSDVTVLTRSESLFIQMLDAASCSRSRCVHAESGLLTEL